MRSYLRELKNNYDIKIADEVYWDPQLNPIFITCNKCKANWVPNPSSDFYQHNAYIGGTDPNRCPNCGSKAIHVGRDLYIQAQY